MDSETYTEKENYRDKNTDADTDSDTQPVEIKADLLSPRIMNSIIQEFIQREGTDYGNVEASLETKINQIYKQIQKNEIHIVFDPATESVNLMTKSDFLKNIKNI